MEDNNFKKFLEKERIKDIYGICDWFSMDEENGKIVTIYDLYWNKQSVWLNYFMNSTITQEEWEKIKDNREQQLDLTLDYLYPLLRDGKLKIKILYHELEKDWENLKEYKLVKSKEYTQEESKQAIEDIKREWLSFDDTREREFWNAVSIIYFIRKWLGLLKKRNWKQWITLRDFHSSDTQVRDAGFKHEVTMDLLKWKDWKLQKLRWEGSEIKFLLPNQ